MLEIDLIAEAERRYGKSLEEQHGEFRGKLMRDSYRPAVHLYTPSRPGADVMPNSWFGGEPSLPNDIAWPVYTYEGVDYPMSFVLQLDCADVPRFEQYPDFPERGVLLFFFEFQLQVHRAQSQLGDEGGAVVYVEDATGIAPRTMPEVPDIPPFPIPLTEESMFTLDILAFKRPKNRDGKRKVFKQQFIEPIVCGYFDIWAVGIERINNEIEELEKWQRNLCIYYDKQDLKQDLLFSSYLFGIRDPYIVNISRKICKLVTIGESEGLPILEGAHSYYIESDAIKNNTWSKAITHRGL